jgi:hypothetical protein
MNTQFEVGGLDLAKDQVRASGGDVSEPDGRVDASELVHFLEDVSTFLAHRDDPS